MSTSASTPCRAARPSAGDGGQPGRRGHPLAAPVLELEGLTTGYGDLPVVPDVSLCVRPGQVVALFGPMAPARPRPCSAPWRAAQDAGAGAVARGTDPQAATPAGAGRPGVRSGGAVDHLQPDRTGQPAPGRGSVQARLDEFPELEEHLGPQGRTVVRRAAADAHADSRAGVEAGGTAGRDEASLGWRPSSCSDCCRRCAARRTAPSSPCCWSSSRPGAPCRWPIAGTC